MSYKRRRTHRNFRAQAVPDQRRAFSINIMLIIAVVVALSVNALFINHLNTMSFKINDLAREESRLADRGTELKSHIAALQTLENIEKRAAALGMVAVDDYRFLSSSETVVAQR